MKLRSFVLIILFLFLCGCSSSQTNPAQSSAKQISLEDYVGTTIINDGLKDLDVFAGMNLYNGYSVDTELNSYDWILLDEARLMKMDQRSKTSIKQEGKSLHIFLEEGSLFFCISNSLDDDEQLSFETANASLSIRGTTGIIKYYDDTTVLILLEGKVKLYYANNEQFSSITTSGVYTVTNDRLNMGEIFPGGDVPGYVQDELENNDMVKEKIEDFDYDEDFMSDQEVLESLKRFVGTYRYKYPLGAKEEDSDLDFYVNDPYILTISLDEDNSLIIDLQASDAAQAAIERYNRICEEKGYSFRFTNEAHYIKLRYPRLQDQNTLIYETENRYFSKHLCEDGGLSDSRYSQDAIWIRVD